jgi:magnesium chelatase subunit D
MKLALLLNAINPRIGGVLIRGERGTAKSTAVRGLAALLPGNMRVVELPVGATEDRVVGSIDVEAAVKAGERRFQPGLLAEADGNILYVDEVNLLDDHLVDVLLDAAAMGFNTVEREGISFTHPASFILVGTMNPEEGELRPQLLDRFGLCVDVSGSLDLADRIKIMEQDEQHRSDAARFLQRAQEPEDELALRIDAARPRQSLVAVPRIMLELAASLAVAAAAYGHRADIVIVRTARTLAALRGRDVVGLEEVQEASELALAHRRRDVASGARPEVKDDLRSEAEEKLRELEAAAAKARETAESSEQAQAAAESTAGKDGEGADTDTGHKPLEASEGPSQEGDTPFSGELFPVRKIDIPRERRQRRAAGKRTKSETARKRGRYVRSTTVEKTTDLAFDATLRAAAPMQRSRRKDAARAGEEMGPRLRLERHDLRQKVRDIKIGNLIVFVVDASASMDAEQRMNATKGAVLSLLRDAYVRRDKVALVVFSGREARVVLRPTSSVSLAERRLSRMLVGGTTPLTHGLIEGLKLIRMEKLKSPDVYPLLVLISDGRGNISVGGEEPLVEAQRLARQIREEGIRSLVIDSARDYSRSFPAHRLAHLSSSAYSSYALNACSDLAEHLGGKYLGLFDLNQRTILKSVQESLGGRYHHGHGHGEHPIEAPGSRSA